jgi:hypothetical protein
MLIALPALFPQSVSAPVPARFGQDRAGQEEDPSDQLLSTPRVISLQIAIPPESAQALRIQPREYVRATVRGFPGNALNPCVWWSKQGLSLRQRLTILLVQVSSAVRSKTWSAFAKQLVEKQGRIIRPTPAGIALDRSS